MKTCPKCNISKSISEFAKAINRKDGLQSTCNDCRHIAYKLNQAVILQKKKSDYYLKRSVFIEKQKKYYSENINMISAYQKAYRINNKVVLSQKQSLRQQQRRATDIGFRLLQNIRRRTSNVIQGNSSTTKYIGCNKDELKYYLESLFTEGMHWNNYGNCESCWNVDHKLPLDSHVRDINGLWKEDSEYNQSLIHYTNLTPMWRKENRLKTNKIL